MTAREVFEGMLIELSKVKAPSLLLEDFNYLFNKAINLYVNKRYNIYDVNQQTTDDLRVLKATAILTPKLTDKYNDRDENGNFDSSIKDITVLKNLYGNTYEFDLPMDYLHMLNCICVFKVRNNHKCYDKNSYVSFPATRLTSDQWAQVINDYYNKPCYKRPYYFIHNVNTKTDLITNPYVGNSNGNDLIFIPTENGEVHTDDFKIAIPDTLKIKDFEGNDHEVNVRNKTIGGLRNSNRTPVRCEIRYGKDDSVFKLVQLSVDYIKSPQKIRLTQEQLDLTEDTSQIMEFPDYVCQEIINELVMLVMENSADPRLQSNLQVSQSIALPTQQLEQRPPGRPPREA